MPAADYDLAATGRAIAEPARAAMLVRMMDGQAHTARDLAEAAGISPSTASPHLRHLIDAGLVIVTVAGRRRLHSLTSSEVAAAIEALAVVSPLLPVESLRQARTGSRLQLARVCYSHLGGSLAVTLAHQFANAGVVEPLAPGEVGVLHPGPPATGSAIDNQPVPRHGADRARVPGLDRTQRASRLQRGDQRSPGGALVGGAVGERGRADQGEPPGDLAAADSGEQALAFDLDPGIGKGGREPFGEVLQLVGNLGAGPGGEVEVVDLIDFTDR